jgi:hypothetical protein
LRMSAGLHRICCCGGSGDPNDPPPDPWFDNIIVSVFSSDPGGPELCPVCAGGCAEITYVSDYPERFDPARPNARTYAFVATIHPINCPSPVYNCYGFAASFGLSIVKEPYTGYDPHTIDIVAAGLHGYGAGVSLPPKAEKTYYRQAGGAEVILSTNSVSTAYPPNECIPPEGVGYNVQYSHGRVYYQWAFEAWVPNGSYYGKMLATPELTWTILITLEHP